MKKIYFAVLSLLLLGNVGLAQIVVPKSASFTSNEEISNFFLQFPDVTAFDNLSIGGFVSSLGKLNQLTYIGQLEINSEFSLSGLNNVEAIGNGNLEISNGSLTILSNFSGFNKLTTIAGYLRIQATVSGFDILNTINGDSIFFSNEAAPATSIVTSMPTFANLLNFTGNIQISNTNINSINAFNNVISAKRIDLNDNENLTSISGFNNINALEELLILTNPNLTSINAFSGLQAVSGRFWISDHPSLQTITSFGSLTNIFSYQFSLNGCLHLPNTPLLTSIGSLFIDQNPSLLDLSGLNGLTAINDTFSLLDNSALATIAHLGNLNTVGNLFSVNGCNSLTNFSGLNNLISVSDIVIDNNAILSSLSGLENIKGIEINFLGINNNPLLTSCAIKSVCDKISLDLGSSVSIASNSTNCNSIGEVANICNPLKNNFLELNNESFRIYPNPINTTLHIENKGSDKINQINIHNSLGQLVHRVSDALLGNTLAINVAHLQSGIYLAEIVSDNGRVVKKVVKN